VTLGAAERVGTLGATGAVTVGVGVGVVAAVVVVVDCDAEGVAIVA
jgi:hypothetical protein